MKKITLTILHKLPNRVRFKLSNDLKNKKKFEEYLKSDNLTSLEYSYNKINKTIILTFSPDEILLQEAIYRVATAYSIDNGMVPVSLMEGTDYRVISPLSIYAGASIILAGINRVLNGSDTTLQKTMNWIAMGLTTGSLLEHSYFETKRKGMVDLEVLTSIYLLKSFFLNNGIGSVAMMWLTIFGRHLIGKKKFIKEVKLYRIKDRNGKGYHYISNITDDRSIETLSDIFYHITNKGNRPANNLGSERYITLQKQ